MNRGSHVTWNAIDAAVVDAALAATWRDEVREAEPRACGGWTADLRSCAQLR